MPSVQSKPVLRNFKQDLAKKPDLFCAVCCRILYEKDSGLLESKKDYATLNLNDVQWPCRQYGREPLMRKNKYVVCKVHERWSDNVLKWINFVNKHWPNPLVVQRDDGYTILPEPEELKNIPWNEWPYLCLVTTFSSMSTPQRTTDEARMAFPHISGHVSIYRSRAFFGLHPQVDGLPTIIRDPNFVQQGVDVERVARAWQYLVQNNVLYHELRPYHAPSETGLITAADVPRPRPIDRQGFDTEIWMQTDPGPRAAEQNFAQVRVA
ncbi:hypothetical protein BGX28_001031, partial [Mortierella sp. GBA30]